MRETSYVSRRTKCVLSYLEREREREREREKEEKDTLKQDGKARGKPWKEVRRRKGGGRVKARRGGGRGRVRGGG